MSPRARRGKASKSSAAVAAHRSTWDAVAAVLVLAAALAWLPPCVSSARSPGRRALVWGLDLGNDNIVMAAVGRNGVDVVNNDVSGRQTPSAVYFAGDHRLIGEHTTGHAGANPQNLVHHIKSLLEGGCGVPGDDDDRPASGGRALERDDRDRSDARQQGRQQHQQQQQQQQQQPLQGQLELEQEQEQGQQQDPVLRTQELTTNAVAGVAGTGDTDNDDDDSERPLPPAAGKSGNHNSNSNNSGGGGGSSGGGGGDKGASAPSIPSPVPPSAPESTFFCETRVSEDDAGRPGLLAVVQHMGEELELSPSDAIAYLLRHCAEVVAREAGGPGGGAGAEAAAAAAAAERGAASVATSAQSCVVASVPSYFSLRQKRAVLNAARIVGVPMPMVLDEGVAVALSYGVLKGGLPAMDAERPLTVAFVDIGHSCTQVTVAAFTSAGLRVLGRSCERRGGTASAQACMFDLVCGAASKQGVTVKGRPRAEFRLSQALLSTVKTLSANKEARLSVECIDGDKDISMTLTREEAENACAGVADGVSSACREALRATGLAASDVDDVELLGGGSYIPALRRSVEEVFGQDRVQRTMSSSESVARGCALAAAQRSSSFKLRPFQVVDSLCKDLRLVWRYVSPKSKLGNKSGTGISTGGGSSSGSDRGRGGGRGRSRGGAASQKDEEMTGAIDVPAGTPIPWSIDVPVDISGSGGGGGGGGGNGEAVNWKTAGKHRGKVHVHLMEGADRVASYVIDLAPSGGTPAAFLGEGDGGEGGGESEGGGAAPQLKFVFRVDQQGVPSVLSARLEHEEEEVTGFVETHAAVPTSTSETAAAAAAGVGGEEENAGAAAGTETAAVPAATSALEATAEAAAAATAAAQTIEVEAAASTSALEETAAAAAVAAETLDAKGAAADHAAAAAAAATRDGREEATAKKPAVDAKTRDLADAAASASNLSGDTHPKPAAGTSKDSDGGSDNVDAGAAAAASGDRSNTSGEEGVDGDRASSASSGSSGDGGVAEGQKEAGKGGGKRRRPWLKTSEKASPASGTEEAKTTVPRVVTRLRSLPLRVRQTYTGMLEGAALEEARARERALCAQDESVRSVNEARNVLENLVYSTRSSLEPVDGDLSAFIKAKEAAGVLAALEEMEEWLYSPDGTPDKVTFERRSSALRQRLLEPLARKQARASLVAALDDAETTALHGSARLEEARGSLAAPQQKLADHELASIRSFVAETRKKLDVAAQGGVEYGSLLGRLPSQEGEVRKKLEHLDKALAFTRNEHA